MKKFFVILLPVILTVLVLILPDLYFEKIDEIYKARSYENELDIKVAEDISVDKMIDVAADDNSRFIVSEYDEEVQAELTEIGSDVLNQLEEILFMELPDKESLIKNCYYKKTQVVGNSEYNSYVFLICELIFESENAVVHVLYLPDKREILSANVYCFNGYAGFFVDKSEKIHETLGKYYGHDNWTAEIFESEVYFNQGSDREAVQNIMGKMGMFEMEYSGESEIYN